MNSSVNNSSPSPCFQLYICNLNKYLKHVDMVTTQQITHRIKTPIPLRISYMDSCSSSHICSPHREQPFRYYFIAQKPHWRYDLHDVKSPSEPSNSKHNWLGFFYKHVLHLLCVKQFSEMPKALTF